MSELSVFQFEGKDVRYGTDNGDLWFVARDLCGFLGLTNLTMALEGLDPDEKGFRTLHTLGGPQRTRVVNESGMYHLSFKSRKSEAVRFRRKVTYEILPSIRKTGKYELKSPFSVDHAVPTGRELVSSQEITTYDLVDRMEEEKSEISSHRARVRLLRQRIEEIKEDIEKEEEEIRVSGAEIERLFQILRQHMTLEG